MLGISVVIVSYYSNSLIMDCLDSIVECNDLSDKCIEIILVDNSDGNDGLYKQFVETKNYKSIPLYIYKNDNLGYGHGNNLGIKYSNYPYILIMNPDVRLIQPVFNYLLNAFQKDSTVGLIGLKQLNQDRKNVLSIFFRKEYCTLMNNLFFLKLFNIFDFYVERKMFLSGALMCLDKDIFLKAGSFDENIFLYGEENDLLNRINKIGKKGKYISSLRYVHILGDRKYQGINNIRRELASSVYHCNKYGISIEKYFKIRRIHLTIKMICYKIIFNDLMYHNMKEEIEVLLTETEDINTIDVVNF